LEVLGAVEAPLGEELRSAALRARLERVGFTEVASGVCGILLSLIPMGGALEDDCWAADWVRCDEESNSALEFWVFRASDDNGALPLAL
jgi:hypothetical protein